MATNREMRVEIRLALGSRATGPASQVSLVELVLRLEGEEPTERNVDDLVPLLHRVRVLVFFVIQRRSWIVERPRGSEHLGHFGS